MGCCSSSQAGEPGQRLGNTPDDRTDKAARAAAAAERRQGGNTHRQGTSGISAERQDAMRERQVRDELIGKELPRFRPLQTAYASLCTTQKATRTPKMYESACLQEKLRVAVKLPDKTCLLAFEQAVLRRLDGSGRACSQGHNSGRIFKLPARYVYQTPEDALWLQRFTRWQGSGAASTTQSFLWLWWKLLVAQLLLPISSA